jgi:hypothetical protein
MVHHSKGRLLALPAKIRQNNVVLAFGGGYFEPYCWPLPLTQILD